MNRKKLVFAMLVVTMPLGCGGSPTQPDLPSATTLSLSFEYIRPVISEENGRTSTVRMYFISYGKGVPGQAPLDCVLNPSDDYMHYTCPVKIDFPAHFECGKVGQAEQHEVAVLDFARLQRREDGSLIHGSTQVATKIHINGSHTVRVHRDGDKEIGLFTMDTCGNLQ